MAFAEDAEKGSLQERGACAIACVRRGVPPGARLRLRAER